MAERTVDTVIVSDIHLGSEMSRARDALDLLRSLDYKRLILLGDIFSDLNFSRLTRDHWKFLSCIRKLSNPKRKIEVVWVEGNHDHGLSNVMSSSCIRALRERTLTHLPAGRQRYSGVAELRRAGPCFERHRWHD